MKKTNKGFNLAGLIIIFIILVGIAVFMYIGNKNAGSIMSSYQSNVDRELASMQTASSANANNSLSAGDYNICIKNVRQPADAKNVLEFDVWMEWKNPTKTNKLLAFQAGLNFNYAGMANGGKITGAFVPGSADPSLPPPQNAPNWNINPTSKQIRMLAFIVRPSSRAVAIPPSPGIRIGTFRMTNTVPFTDNSKPNFAWHYGTGVNGKTQTKEFIYVNGSTLGSGYLDTSPSPNHCTLPNPSIPIL